MSQLPIQPIFDQAVEHHRSGRLPEAEQFYRQVLTLDPDFAEAHYNLGTVLSDQGRLDESIPALEKAITLRPDFPEAHGNLANALALKGQLDEAIAAYRRAIFLRPNFPEAYSSLGVALKANGQLHEAIAACRQAIALRPNYAEAHNSLGKALSANELLDAAIAAYRQAIALRPSYAEAHFNLGNALAGKQQLDAAIDAFRQAIALRPNYAEAHNNLGSVLKDLGRHDAAIAAYRQAVALRPTFTEAHSNIILTLHYHPADDAQATAGELRRWNDQHAAPLRKFIERYANDPNPQRRLRIGYVSADFFDHCSVYFAGPLLRLHDHNRFEIFCYSQTIRSDEITREIQSHADHWHDTRPWTDEQFARQIRSDQIDILVDLKLHTAHNRLLTFARKPAPIQVSWLGYPGSAGMESIDYRITDRYLEPIGSAHPSPDQPIYLPGCFWCYQPPFTEPSPGPLPALSAGFITFGSLNNFCKITDTTLRLWAATMNAVPGSRLLMLAPQGSARQRVLATFKNLAVDPAQVEFVDRRPRDQYLKLYDRIDMGLDTIPCNGHTTSLDSLWMGVPIVTLPGQTVMGRAGLTQLTNLGLPELIADSPGGYVQIVSTLASDLPRLSQLRQTLRQRMLKSPLCDAESFTREMESAYRRMWRTWCETSG
ncbi:MAG: tetratricopeptide repeat protein [Tepidisphaeraceae bacterium]|jgi:predicted O-linked N-acetylglucosamine transferase (SPINDLY family)